MSNATSNSHIAGFPELLITNRTTTEGHRPGLACLDAEADAGPWSSASQCTNPAQCANCSPGNCGQCFGISDSSRRSALAGEAYYRQAQLSQGNNCAQCANCTPGNCGQCGWIEDASHRLWAEGEKYYDGLDSRP